jgi:hypothetical protein
LQLEVASNRVPPAQRRLVTFVAWHVVPALAMTGIFLLTAAGFFIGKPPLAILTDMVTFAVGDANSLSEDLAKMTPMGSHHAR